MKALIDGSRICEVHDTNTIPFEVADGLEWVDVPDDTQPDLDIWDGSQVLKHAPEPEPPAGDLRATTEAAIKAEAGRRILRRYPEWKQRNMTAAAVVYLDKPARQRTDADRAAAEAARTAWGWISGIRAKSDALETQAAAMDAEALAAFDPAADEHWEGVS